MWIKALKTRHTVGRPLLGFPFYYEPGIRYLKEVRQIKQETELIGRCAGRYPVVLADFMTDNIEKMGFKQVSGLWTQS